MSQVFISYSRKDKDTANIFRKKVEEEGFSVWMDIKILSGRDWRDTIDREIRRSIAVLVVMTRTALNSKYVTYECGFAYGAGVRVIPVTFVDPKSLHLRLNVLQCLDFRKTPSPWKKLREDLRDADSSASQLQVHHAAWGVLHDVTDKLREHVANDGVNLNAKREVFGDPPDVLGKPKRLCVFYSKNGESRVVNIREHDRLVIPKRKPRTPKRHKKRHKH